MNLAIEDYIYNAMPKPEGAKDNSFDRLMFYINTPCVVIGKIKTLGKKLIYRY